MIADFTLDMTQSDKTLFSHHYGVLSAQFHGRCLGQFVQLEFLLKPQYFQYIPTLLQQFKADMDVPILAPIKAWLSAQGMDFAHPLMLDIKADRPYVEALL